jgi:hypothetical protein
MDSTGMAAASAASRDEAGMERWVVGAIALILVSALLVPTGDPKPAGSTAGEPSMRLFDRASAAAGYAQQCDRRLRYDQAEELRLLIGQRGRFGLHVVHPAGSSGRRAAPPHRWHVPRWQMPRQSLFK